MRKGKRENWKSGGGELFDMGGLIHLGHAKKSFQMGFGRHCRTIRSGLNPSQRPGIY